MSLELVRWNLGTKFRVIIYLAVNCEDVFSIVADERLSASVWNCEHKVSKTHPKNQMGAKMHPPTPTMARRS
jgi:hypothetical protein